jgi:hypothetical protein
MRIVIDINEESGESIMTIDDREPQGGYHAQISQNREITPIYSIGYDRPMMFLNGMEDFIIKLSRLGKNNLAAPMPEMKTWDPAEDWHTCDYYDCPICYEEE